MKTWAWIFSLILSGAAFSMSSFPNGAYEGKGRTETDSGVKNGYGLTVIIHDGSFEFDFKFGGQGKRRRIDTEFVGATFFRLTVDGVPQKFLSYCRDSWCHLEWTEKEGNQCEETFV